MSPRFGADEAIDGKGSIVRNRSAKFETLRYFLCAEIILAIATGKISAEDFKPQTVSLFNGKDLAGLSTWLKDTKKEDPRKVFRVENGMIHVSGEGFGYLATDQEYKNFRLVVEYKWGKKTDGGKSVRNAGILLNATGPDGNAGGEWMSSIECQLAQGCVGDFIVIRGKDEDGKIIPTKLVGEVAIGRDKHPRWKEKGEDRIFNGGQLWWSRHDPDFKEWIDTRGKDDMESPVGEWTRVECVCDGDRIEVLVNGTKVNACKGVFPKSGKILLQSEGFEWWIRKFELTALRQESETTP